MAQMVFSKNIDRYRESLFVDPTPDPFFLFMFCVGVAIILAFPASAWIGVLAMAMPIIPVINRVLFGDRSNAFFEEFNEDLMNTFIKNFVRYMHQKGAGEYDIASDVYTLKVAYNEGDGEATMICLMHMANKVEFFSDVSDIHEAVLPAVHPGEEPLGDEGASIQDPDDGDGLPAGRSVGEGS